MSPRTAQAQAADQDELDLGDLRSLLGFNVRLAYVAMYRDFAASVADLDLTQKQFAVLTIIDANAGPSQIDIAAALGMDRATMMELIDRLQDRQLVERRRSTGDRRRQELYLTASGKKLFVKAAARIKRHEENFTKKFTQAELRELFQSLRRLQAQM